MWLCFFLLPGMMWGVFLSSDHSGVSMGVNDNDNVQYVKDKSGNNRDMSNDIAHASYAACPLTTKASSRYRLELL